MIPLQVILEREVTLLKKVEGPLLLQQYRIEGTNELRTFVLNSIEVYEIKKRKPGISKVYYVDTYITNHNYTNKGVLIVVRENKVVYFSVINRNALETYIENIEHNIDLIQSKFPYNFTAMGNYLEPYFVKQNHFRPSARGYIIVQALKHVKSCFPMLRGFG